jgi:hypothetical protein
MTSAATPTTIASVADKVSTMSVISYFDSAINVIDIVCRFHQALAVLND